MILDGKHKTMGILRLTCWEGCDYSYLNMLSWWKILDIKDLESKIDELIEMCDEFERKNAVMHADQEKWLQERTRLLEKNELAKSKVEAMIMRLKALEQD